MFRSQVTDAAGSPRAKRRVISPVGGRTRLKRRHAPAKTLREKAAIIAEVEAGMRCTDVANKYNIKKSTLSGWLANRQQIRAALKTRASLQDFRRVRGSFNAVLDRDLFAWYKQMREDGVSIHGGMLHDEANRISAGLDTDEVSKSWIERWKKRHGLTIRKHQSKLDDGGVFLRSYSDLINDKSSDSFTQDSETCTGKILVRICLNDNAIEHK